MVDRVRKEITRGKVLSDDWLNVMRVWHQLGGKSSATMMFGHAETLSERIEHLDRIRQLQDETQGSLPLFAGRSSQTTPRCRTSLRLVPLSTSRRKPLLDFILDNVPNIQSSWVTQGLKIGQLALAFGANDMGSLMIEENVVAEAGTVHYLTLDQIRGAIEEHGFVARQRNVFYQLVTPITSSGPSSPIGRNHPSNWLNYRHDRWLILPGTDSR